MESQNSSEYPVRETLGFMGRTTFDLPDQLHNELSAAVRERGITIGIAINQAVQLWLDASETKLSGLSGPMVGLNSRNRKKVERYIELLQIAKEDIRSAASRRVDQFLVIARDERGDSRRLKR